MAMFQITKLFQILNKGSDDVYLIFISLYIAQHHKHVLLHYRFWIFPLQNSESTLFSATVLIILAKSMERCSCIKNLFELEFTLQCILSIFSFGAIWKQNLLERATQFNISFMYFIGLSPVAFLFAIHAYVFLFVDYHIKKLCW